MQHNNGDEPGRIDFDSLRADNPIADVVGRYVDLKRAGSEYAARCPFHADKSPSFYVVPKKDKAFCMGCGWHGDVVDFVAAIERCEVGEAARRLGGGNLPPVGSRPAPPPLPPDDSDEWVPVMPVPDGLDQGDARDWTVWNPKRASWWRFTAVHTWAYRDASGALLGYVARIEYADRKITPTITYCRQRTTGEERWCSRPFPTPRPLYGLDQLAARPNDPVLYVSGEKCAETGRRMFPRSVVVTNPGGDRGIASTDLAPLASRRTTITAWPDLDRQNGASGARLPYAEQSGVRACVALLTRLASLGAGSLKLVDLSAEFAGDDLPDGWDIADAEKDGWEAGKVRQFGAHRLTVWKPPVAESVPPVAGKTPDRQPLTGGGPTSGVAANGDTSQRPGVGAYSTRTDVSEHEREREEEEVMRSDRRHHAEGQSAETGGAHPSTRVPIDPAKFGEPLNLLGTFTPPRIEADWLPVPLQAFVADQGALLGCDPSSVALGCIVSCAAVLHDGIEIQPKRFDPTWRESARLWGALVGDPSTRKTPAMRKATSHLRKIDMDLQADSDGKLAEHERQVKIHRKKEAAWIGQEARGGNGDDDRPPEAPKAPPRERVIAEDITVEALSEVLKDNPRGMAVMADELSGWIGSMDAYKGNGGKDRGHWLEAFNGGGRRIDRIGRGSILVPNWSVCIIGGIQPDAIRKISGSLYDDGLLQRFLVVCGQPAQNGSEDRAPDMDAIKAYHRLLDALFQTQPSDNPVVLSSGAHRWREELSTFARTLAQCDVLTTGFRAHLGKWDGLYARLLLTYHAIETRSEGQYPASVPVAAATAQRVHDLMRYFLFPHAAAFYMTVLGRSERDAGAEWIANWVLAEKRMEVTLRDVTQSYKKWRTLPDWQQRQTMRVLEDAGWLLADGETVERRVNRWAVNPRVHERFAEQAETAKRRREEARESLHSAMSVIQRNADNADNMGNQHTTE